MKFSARPLRFFIPTGMIVIAIAVVTSFMIHSRMIHARQMEVFMQPFNVPLKGNEITPDSIPIMDDAVMEKLFGKPRPFDPDRTPEQIVANCARWEEPVPDADAQRWYRAATTIQNKGFGLSIQGAKEFHQMQILYEGAARKGHFRAINNLIWLYGRRVLVNMREEAMPAQPAKARAWMNYSLTRKWPAAVQWAASALYDGFGNYGRSEEGALVYMQQAADLGSAVGQFGMSKYFHRPGEMDKRTAWLECAANQNYSLALMHLGRDKQIDEFPKAALELYQRAVMAGGESGGDAAFALSWAFEKASSDQRELRTFPDPIREKAYANLGHALNNVSVDHHNSFYRFPRLNEVLPLPPAEVKEWKGIYSAMSAEDAEYYQNPTDPEILIEEIRKAGLLVDDDYLTKPVYVDPDTL
ncbi:MAG: DUF6396 domain-containing protein [Zoogloeaceae bacterium]|jgi:hypothetical protein|nr:DUF6396 domain-containing protein [Zoogloeaceae bacterium]